MACYCEITTAKQFKVCGWNLFQYSMHQRYWFMMFQKEKTVNLTIWIIVKLHKCSHVLKLCVIHLKKKKCMVFRNFSLWHTFKSNLSTYQQLISKEDISAKLTRSLIL
jgi:hypothetical protein